MAEVTYMSEPTMEPTPKTESNLEYKSETNLEPTSNPTREESNLEHKLETTLDTSSKNQAITDIVNTLNEIKVLICGMDAATITLSRSGRIKVEYELSKYDKYRKYRNFDEFNIDSNSPQELETLKAELTEAMNSLRTFKFPFEETVGNKCAFVAMSSDLIAAAIVVIGAYFVYKMLF